jgi:hypothetical protein
MTSVGRGMRVIGKYTATPQANYRIVPALASEMLTVAARLDLGVLDEKLYLLDIRMTLVVLSKLLVRDIVEVCKRPEDVHLFHLR